MYENKYYCKISNRIAAFRLETNLCLGRAESSLNHVLDFNPNATISKALHFDLKYYPARLTILGNCVFLG